ncbi:hypothetical protein AeNC1_017176 [Aphanomyces euteiches]|nr:hypothetical protein AeNC1_017176 [Aphanomyces euteiches]
MKRPRLSLPLVLTMPVDVILKIAFSIPNAADFFAFLESLHPYGVLGPLEHLYQLSLTQRQSELWPNLKIDSMALKQERRTHYEIIAKYYPKVILDDILDVQWVKKLDIQKIVLALYNHVWISFFDFTKTWARVLPQFNHLTTLKVSTRDGYVFNEVCAFAAKSERLIHLEINYVFERVTSLAAQSLIEWFHRPVQFFSFAGPGWSAIDDNHLKQEFYRAMFNCPTLQTLKLHRCSLKDLNLSQLDFSMKSLLVERCHVNRLFLKSLTERLEISKISYLGLQGYTLMDQQSGGLYHLLQHLPHLSMKHLFLSDDMIQSSELTQLVPLLEHCRLESLAFRAPSLSKAVVAKFAKAIQNNQTICELDLGTSKISMDELRLLMESFTDSSRLVKTKRIKIHPTQHRMKLGAWKQLKKLTGERGGELVEIEAFEDYS